MACKGVRLISALASIGLAVWSSGCAAMNEEVDMANHGCSPAYTSGYIEVKYKKGPPLIRLIDEDDSQYLKGKADAAAEIDWRTTSGK